MTQPPPAGWFPDPNNAQQRRYWDGSAWTEHVSPAPGVTPITPAASAPTTVPYTTSPAASGGIGEWVKQHKVWTAVIAVVVIGIIAGIAGGGSSSSGEAPAAQQGTTIPSSTSAATTATPGSSASPLQKARSALGDEVSSPVAVGDSKVKGVAANGNVMTVTLVTPEGGFQGPSTDDADGLTAAAMSKVYRTGWSGAAVVRFVGGLQSRATGKPLPHALAFAYYIGRRQAARIEWSNQDRVESIDWSFYRTVCHPAFKGCT